MKKGQPLTPEERKARSEHVKELFQKLENDVRDLFTSDRFFQFLTVMGKFHHYSLCNQYLILSQCPTATRVAGFQTWKSLGRFVKKGEKGIEILAPIPSVVKTEEKRLDENGEETVEEVLRSYMRYRSVYVFDIAQTEGKELPSLGVNELEGSVSDFEKIFEALCSMSSVPVIVGDESFFLLSPGAKGYYSRMNKRIVIRSGMSQVQTIKTLVHELAHSILHSDCESANESRNQKEVEAEGTAAVVCSYFGINTSDYSVGYVAGWSERNDTSTLLNSLQNIHSCAEQIIVGIEAAMSSEAVGEESIVQAV